MNCTDCTSRLHDYVDGELSVAERHDVDVHVARCDSCRAELDSLRDILAQARTLPTEIPPARDLWPELATQLNQHTWSLPPRHSTAAAPGISSPRSLARVSWLAPLATAASIIALAALAEQRLRQSDHVPAWSVAAVDGAPLVGAQPVQHEAKFRLGQWLETDASSRAKVSVGAIGEVNVEPNSRLRLVGVAATDHRLELARGTMRAFIWAPPRLFFVDTPSAIAVDLGCAYTLAVDDAGNGELNVTTGYVALEDRGRESIVRSGMKCLTRRGEGPGTPFAADAPEPLQAALERFDFERGAAPSALREVLALARPEDVVTLWHLLARTNGDECGRVFDVLAKFTPPPEGVTRAGIAAGDGAMRKAWAAALGIDRL